MKRALFALAIVAAFGATPALAHAHLQHANPRVGAIVNAAPREIRLEFSLAVEPAQSRVMVMDAANRMVALGPLSLAPHAPSIMIAPIHGALAPGVYHVSWAVMSIDDHPSHGDFSFTVGR